MSQLLADVYKMSFLPFSYFIDYYLKKHANEIGNSIALANHDGSKDSITFAQLYEDAHRLQAFFTSVGIGRGDVVAVYLGNTWQAVLVYLGVVFAGATVNASKAYTKNEHRRFHAERCGAKFVIVSEDLVQDLEEIIGEGGSIKEALVFGAKGDTKLVIPLHSLSEALAHSPNYEPAEVRDPQEEIPFLNASSGTTGDFAKLIKFSQTSLSASIPTCMETMQRVFLDPEYDLRRKPSLVYFHYGMLALVWIMGGLVAGTKTIFIHKTHPQTWIDAVIQYRTEFLIGFPGLLDAMLSEETLRKRQGLDHLKAVVYCGAPIHDVMLRRFHEAFPKLTTFGLVYGSTECGPITCVQGIDWATCGRPFGDRKFKILNLETGEECVPGVPGEILIKTRSLVSGYVGAEHSFERLGDGFYKTGDYGLVDEKGHITVFDRIKDTFIYQGLRILPSRWESAIMDLDLVHDVAVVGLEDDEQPGERVPAIFVEEKAAKPANKTEIKEFLEARYKVRLQREIEVISRIPRIPSGKIRRIDLIRGRPAPTEGFVVVL